MTEVAFLNETHSMFERKTRDGRTLRYEMSILQQPQRARACGSGAKSSADRRPVDPPPVVELRIFDGENDITFAHNASFFLYTTLENARTIATPKGVVPSQQPVLTGAPVAGMAYLDRPSHAGYFIFPDLSVRHEGKYRLSFNLFEEVKCEADADAEPNPLQDHPNASKMRFGISPPFGCVNFRLEVKSEPFSVFSAKKFPGLTESTTLSRHLSEQGCRVRIRRDVRIRVRKDVKSSNDSPFSGESAESLDHTHLDQTRSVSNSSAIGHHQQYPSVDPKDEPYIKQSPYTPQPSYSSHLPYGSTQQYQPPSLPTYNAPIYHKHHSRQNSTSDAQPQSTYPLPVYNHTNPPTRDYIVEIEAPKPQPRYYGSSLTRSSTPTITASLPPLKSIQSSSSLSSQAQNTSSSTGSTTSSTPSSTTSTISKPKRGYSSVFSDPHISAPVQYGARPETSGVELDIVDTEEHGQITEDELAAMKNMLAYRRADGTRHLKQIPTSQFL